MYVIIPIQHIRKVVIPKLKIIGYTAINEPNHISNITDDDNYNFRVIIFYAAPNYIPMLRAMTHRNLNVIYTLQ